MMDNAVNPDRVKKYIDGLKEALRSIMGKGLDRDYSDLMDAVKRYLSDAEYYYVKGDYETALTAVAYAEGLLDSLKYMGVTEAEWPQRTLERRVFLAGTFDLIHPGHIKLMEWASSYGKLYVVVARDVNVVKMKGKKPVLREQARLELVKAIRYVYDALLGDENDIFKPLELIRPDVVVLGPDQGVSEEDVIREVEKRLGYKPVVVRYPSKEYYYGVKSSSDIIKTICQGSYCKIVSS